MKLDQLLGGVEVFERPVDARKFEITHITETLEEVRPGTLFFCVPGANRDGHDFANEAVERGAVALIIERDIEAEIPTVRVSNVRAAIAPVACAFYDNPARKMRMFAVTGTNGKTTVSTMLQGILQRHRWKTEVIGTLTSFFTTPPAIALQRQLAEFRSAGCQAVSMEVSSMALDQFRVDGISYEVGIFTNLTQDHLDYHGSMEHYFQSKAKLFEPGRVETAVVNVDDEYGRRLVDRIAVPIEPYSLSNAKDLEFTSRGSSFSWHGKQVELPLFGEFNVYNALAAATAARCAGVSIETIVDSLNNAPQVPGRMELIDRQQPFAVVVDFAHTPDGLKNVLTTARRNVAKDGKLFVVFGCAGDRDKGKRPITAAIMEDLADEVVVTSDNSRSEDPATIVNEMLAGMKNSSRARVFLNRRTAIQKAIANARPGDVVVIAGKGHERTQEIGGVKHPFDDRVVAADAVDEWVGKHGREGAVL